MQATDTAVGVQREEAMQRAAHQEANRNRMPSDLRGLTGAHRTLLVGSLLVLASLFLPWWNDGFGSQANGFHDWGWLTAFAWLLVVALLLARRLRPQAGARAGLAVDDGVAYAIGGIAEMLGAVVFWLANNSRLMGGVRYGVFLAVVGGAVTVAAGYVQHLQQSGRPGG